MSKKRTIVDAHAHVFSSVKGRTKSGSKVSSSFGKVKTEKGEERILPPYFKDTSFPVEMLVELMDREEVHKAVLLQNPMYGTRNDEIRDAIKKYPGRFAGTIQVDPLDEGAVEIIKRYSALPEQSILKFEMSSEFGWTGLHEGLKLDDEPFMKIWEAASKLSLQVIIDPGPINNSGYQVDVIDRLTSDCASLTFLLEHFGYLTADTYNDSGCRERRLRLIKLAKKKNVYLGFSATAALLKEEYPCPESLKLLKETVGLIGAEKILWGTDIPTTLNLYTYRQMIEVVLKHSNFLSDDEKSLISFCCETG